LDHPGRAWQLYRQALVGVFYFQGKEKAMIQGRTD